MNNPETTESNYIENLFDEEALTLAKKRELWRVNKPLFQPVVNAFRKIRVEPTFTGDLNISLAGDKAALIRAIRILRTGGFSTNSDRPAKGATSWYAYFAHPDSSLRIWFYFTATVCRRVQVGVKMVEQPIYETVCEGLDLPAPGEAELLPESVKGINHDSAPF